MSGPALADWPRTRAELEAAQERLGEARPPPWRWDGGPLRVAGCAVVSRRGGPEAAENELGFAAAALVEVGGATLPARTYAESVGALRAGFEAGLLALREGPLLAEAVVALAERPDLLLVHAAGRDHPRGSGLAVMLGAALDLPSIGVTRRPLVATGPLPEDRAGAHAPLWRHAEEVARWVRTRAGVHPVVAHAGWRTTPALAAELVLAATRGARFPEPLRCAVQRARALRDGRAA